MSNIGHEKGCPEKKTAPRDSHYLEGWRFCPACKRLLAPKGYQTERERLAPQTERELP